MGVGGWSETDLFSYIWHTEYLLHCQFYILQGLRVGKWINLHQLEKNATITTFDKPISNRFSSNIRTENMVVSHPFSLSMKYVFEKSDVKFLCLEVFGRLLLSQCLYCYSRKFLKGVFERFQFKVAMCFHSFVVDIRKIQFLLKRHGDQTWLQILQNSLIR